MVVNDLRQSCAVAVALLVACGGADGGRTPSASPGPPSGGPSAGSAIVVSFWFDRMGGGPYTGGGWVSVPDFKAARGQDVVSARATGVSANGGEAKINPSWTPSDSEMVTVSPNPADLVSITVNRAGESKLEVSWQGMVKELIVRATSQGGKVVQVEILQ